MKRFLSLAVAAFALASSVTLVSTTSASAHDGIVSTTPAASSQVAPGQVKVSITFSEAVMNAGDGAGLAIEVTSPEGSVLESQCLSVSDATLSAGIDATTVGEYSVDWRAVSSDGHANSGTFAFAVAEGADAAEAPAADATCLNVAAEATPMLVGAEAPEERTLTSVDPADETPVAVSAGETPEQTFDPLTGLGMGIGLFLVISFIGIGVVEFQKRSRAREAELKKDSAED